MNQRRTIDERLEGPIDSLIQTGRHFILFVILLVFLLSGVSGAGANPARLAASATSVNDGTVGTNTNQFEFVGKGWRYRSAGQPSYLTDDHYSKAVNDYYQVRFNGTQAKIYTAKGPGLGIAAVSIDGGSETLVDHYAANRSNQVLVYASPTLADAAHILKVRVTGTKNSSASDSNVIADRVDAGVELPPANTALPVISGAAAVGETLAASTGSWSNSPTSYAYQWQRCNVVSAICIDVAGAKGQSYLLSSADQGSTMRVVVTASNSAGSAAATSSPSAVVQAASPWTTVLNDTFDSGGVPSHWNLYQFRYSSSNNCATPSHTYVSGGYLRLLMRYESSGWCGAGWYTGGMSLDGVAPYASVDQRITVRFRVVSSGVVSHRIIPMRWPTSAPQPSGGEEDYCESHDLAFCSTFLHYGSGQDVRRQHFFDLKQWHTLRFERRNFTVKVWIDDLVNPVWTYSGNATTLPATVKAAVLQQECKPLWAGGCPSGTAGTEEIQVDWITIENPA